MTICRDRAPVLGFFRDATAHHVRGRHKADERVGTKCRQEADCVGLSSPQDLRGNNAGAPWQNVAALADLGFGVFVRARPKCAASPAVFGF